MQGKAKYLMLFWGALFVLAACASLQQQVTVATGESETVVTMEADNFKFKPNNIKTYQGNIIVFKISNVSENNHNFTIKDPDDKMLQSVDLPSKATVEVKIMFPKPGKYNYDCDKPFHSSLGMKGQVEVAKKEGT
jgi:plastocyanin